MPAHVVLTESVPLVLRDDYYSQCVVCQDEEGLGQGEAEAVVRIVTIARPCFFPFSATLAAMLTVPA